MLILDIFKTFLYYLFGLYARIKYKKNKKHSSIIMILDNFSKIYSNLPL